MKKKIALGLFVAVGCLYYAIRGISFQTVYACLRHAQFGWIAVALALYNLGYLIRAYRWAVLLRPLKRVSARSAFDPMIIGFFANNILPLRMGELVRAHLGGKKFGISRTACLGTILLERLCDTVSFLTTFLVVTFVCNFPKWVEKGATLLALACAGLMVALALILTHQKRFHAWLAQRSLSARWKTRLQTFVNDFAEGVSSLRSLRHAAAALGLSLVIWTLEGSFLYWMARALHLPVGYPQAFFLLFFMGLSVTLPQAPGYVGTVELFGVTALTALGLAKTNALSLILAIHVTQFLYIIVLGFWALSQEGLSLHALATQGAGVNR